MAEDVGAERSSDATSDPEARPQPGTAAGGAAEAADDAATDAEARASSSSREDADDEARGRETRRGRSHEWASSREELEEAARRARARFREHRRAWRQRRGESRKERVVHTRISDELHDVIQRVAEELRVPVSNLVRNSLEDAFRVGAAVGDLFDDLVERARAQTEGAAAGPRNDADEHTSRRARRHGRRDDATTASADTARSAADERTEARASTPPVVLGWQPLVLHRPQRCASCGDVLHRGTDAFAAVSTHGLAASYACARCVRSRD